MTEPLTTIECDLRNFAFMPLDVLRLRDSEFSALASGDEFRAGVLLWAAAWHQVPAASLPDDDRILAVLAGYGRGVNDWLAVREGALRGFIKCSDGRLYHPVIAEKANEAWRSKQAQLSKTEAARAAKSGKKAAVTISVTDVVTEPVTDVVTDGATPSVTGSNREGEGYRERKKEPPNPQTLPEGFAEAWACWPEAGKRRSSKAKAAEVWRRIADEAGGGVALAQRVAAFAESPDARRDGGQFVPALERWLRDGKWEHWWPKNPETTGDPNADDDKRIHPQMQRNWMRDFLEYGPGGWREHIRGPNPRQPGCLVSPEIMAEFGFTPVVQAGAA